MLIVRILIIGLLLSAGISTALAQAVPSPSGKIAVINSGEFGDEKAGILKYVNAVKSLNSEFSTVQTELKTMASRLEALSKEVDQAPKAVADPKVLQTKIDEAEKLQRDIKFNSEDAKFKYEKRQQTVLGPVMQDIYKALQDFSKQKGYLLIFDAAKDDAGLLVAIGDEKAIVTRDFIAYYNARSAATTVPK